MLKVMIVEDEPILRQGIVTLLDWEEMGFEVFAHCANGIEAIELLNKNKIDLVVSDIKMPGMDGLELAAHIHNYYPEVSVILLTAHSDFEYAQKALRLGVCDYVLKNNFVQSLPEAVQSLMERKYQNPTISGEGISASVGRSNLKTLLKGILDGSIQDGKEISDLFAHYLITLDNFYVIALEISFHSPHKHEGDISAAPIISFLSSALEDCFYFCTELSPNNIYVIVNCSKKDQGIGFLARICNDIINTLAKYAKHEIHIGISGCHHDPVEVKMAGDEALYAISRIFDDVKMIAYKDISPLPAENPSLSMSKIRDQIFAFFELSDIKSAHRYMHDVFHTYLNCNAPISKVRIDMTVLISLCCEKWEGYNLDNAACERIKLQASSEIMGILTLKAIYYLIINICTEISSSLNSEGAKGINRLIAQTDSYIKEHYAMPIKLDDIADHLHINSSYLSRLYKKETGNSLVAAINKFRVERAKELLSSGKHLVSEVGAIVGIEDPAYFTKVFTKYAGFSPKQSKRLITANAKNAEKR